MIILVGWMIHTTVITTSGKIDVTTTLMGYIHSSHGRQRKVGFQLYAILLFLLHFSHIFPSRSDDVTSSNSDAGLNVPSHEFLRMFFSRSHGLSRFCLRVIPYFMGEESCLDFSSYSSYSSRGNRGSKVVFIFDFGLRIWKRDETQIFDILLK